MLQAAEQLQPFSPNFGKGIHHSAQKPCHTSQVALGYQSDTVRSRPQVAFREAQISSERRNVGPPSLSLLLWDLGRELASACNGYLLAAYLDRGTDTEQACMAGLDTPISSRPPGSNAAPLPLFAGQDQITKLARVAYIGEGSAIQIDGHSADI
jgi:hypothetical protein